MQREYLHILVFFIMGTVFSLVTFALAKLLRARNFDVKKGQAYECGMSPIGSPWISMNIRFYVFALFFVIFDVEAVFLFPWAVQFGELGLKGFIAMILFLDVLFAGLIYAWRKGALKWE